MSARAYALLLLSLSVCLRAGESPGDAAYRALREGDLDRAVANFRLAIAANPGAAHLHKDFAYTLLKTGEREQARDQFAQALHINAQDEQSALEYGFLCYETHLPVEARRMFMQWKDRGSDQTRRTAAAAFENIDRPLRDGIARWKDAVAAAPGQWSAHEELARLAEQRDEFDLAADQYALAMNLRPAERRLMIDLARVWKAQGRTRDSVALLLAASRSIEPRIAESARELLPARYPYLYEFEDALKVDPDNEALRREFAFQLLALGKKDQARQQFELQLSRHPNDRLSFEQLRTLRDESKPPAPAAKPAPVPSAGASLKEMGLKSYYRGYLNDALRFLQAAWEEQPGDAEVALRLGWTLNMLKRDNEALEWFDRARRSGVEEFARDADRAVRNLRSQNRPLELTVWLLPMYSTRWETTFLYSQAKLEFKKLKVGRVQPYLSVRWYGDTRGRESLPGSQGLPGAATGPMLSDSAFIAAGGLNVHLTSRLFAWAEAGRAFSYMVNSPASGSGQQDYRGGLSYLKGWGAFQNNGESGWFSEAGGDGVFVSRYDHDGLAYIQSRHGYTLPELPGGLRLQALWNLNGTVDVKRQWWGNFLETGPGIRFRWSALPPSVSFRTDFLRGAYLVNQDNPRRPNYWDLRASLWYAISR